MSEDEQSQGADTELESIPLVEDTVWMARVTAVVDEAHVENLGGEHRVGFCKACAAAYLVAQRAVPRTLRPRTRHKLATPNPKSGPDAG